MGEYEGILKSLPKKTLKRREVIVKTTDLGKGKEKQGKIKFSICCWPLSMYSRSSGPGDDATNVLHVYYESKNEPSVIGAFAACGVDLESAEPTPVDPKSPLDHEQQIMYMPQCLYFEGDHFYEECSPLSVEEIKKKLVV